MIRVQNLIKTFGKVTAVGGITFDVQAGEIFAFLKPNGGARQPSSRYSRRSCVPQVVR